MGKFYNEVWELSAEGRESVKEAVIDFVCDEIMTAAKNGNYSKVIRCENGDFLDYFIDEGFEVKRIIGSWWEISWENAADIEIEDDDAGDDFEEENED